jgi:hypothetical protein
VALPTGSACQWQNAILRTTHTMYSMQPAPGPVLVQYYPRHRLHTTHGMHSMHNLLSMQNGILPHPGEGASYDGRAGGVGQATWCAHPFPPQCQHVPALNSTPPQHPPESLPCLLRMYGVHGMKSPLPQPEEGVEDDSSPVMGRWSRRHHLTHSLPPQCWRCCLT